MAEGKEEQEWWHTASLMATLINMLSVKGNVDAAKLHPMIAKKKEKPVMHLDRKNFGLLKGMLGL